MTQNLMITIRETTPSGSVLLGYNHNQDPIGEQEAIGAYLKSHPDQDSLILLEGAEGPYLPGTIKLYERLDSDLEELLGIPIRFNDNEQLIKETLALNQYWASIVESCQKPSVILREFKKYQKDYQRLAREREWWMCETIVRFKASYASVYQVIGAGHLFSGSIPERLEELGIGYRCLVTQTAFAASLKYPL